MSTPANLSEQITAAPVGAGAVRSVGETFAPDPYTGTGRYVISIPFESGPAGSAPTLSLTWSSARGSGAAGLGWDFDLAAVRRRLDKGIPVYDEARDRFALQEDELVSQGSGAYRFRIEGRFARVTHVMRAGQDAWVVTERDGTRTFYGDEPSARLTDGAGRIAAWFVTRKEDANGNRVVYSYVRDPRTTEVQLAHIDWAGCYRAILAWERRPDPIVSARAGFATRIDHRVASIALQVQRGDTGVLHTYRRYDLAYTLSRWTGRSLLARVTATGISPDGAERSLPPVTFAYGDADLAQARWRAVEGDVPNRALSSRDVTLVRQSGSGLPDILETRPTGHYLRVNEGQGRFAAARIVPAPALVALSDPGTFLSDMDGDGYADLVVGGGRRVYASAQHAGGWGGTYQSAVAPSIDLDAPDVRLADLTGNGLPDVLRSGASGWTFIENLGRGRWATPRLVMGAPSLRLDDPRVHLADIDGDGLADLAYVDATGVTVWPAVGRGAFGAPYQLLGGPRFGFGHDPRDVRLVDVTGSGQADVLHVQDGVVRVAFNLAGVALSPLTEVGRAPLSSHGHVEITDLLGTGCHGVLFTDQGAAWRFRELFTAGPLDQLSVIENGIGGTTAIAYSTSAIHWARDLRAGRAWRTGMPIATQVVDRVSMRDRTTGTELATTYHYAHGVYDGLEREFRGFARVTQLDREAPQGDPEPIAQVQVVRWFHTGAALDLRDEWFAVPGEPLADVAPDHPWARRALRGLVRREETYAIDGERRPYLVSERAYRACAVGRTFGLESAWAPLLTRQRDTHVERGVEVRQTEVVTTYDLDATPGHGYGLPVEVREIGYGRSGQFVTPHEQQQAETLERLTRTAYVNLDRPDIDDGTAPYTPSYLVGKRSEEERFGLTASGLALLAKTRWFYDGADYQGLGHPRSGTSVGVTRGRLSAQLTLSFTDSTFADAFPIDSGAAAARDARGHYLVDGDEHYVHTQRTRYLPNGQPSGSLDPNGNESTVEYDAIHSLFAERTVDALGHPIVLERGTLPFQLAALNDANGNRTEFTYDALAVPATRTVMGKEVDGVWQGDPPSHPTETYDYDLDSLPIRVTTRARQRREGPTLDVHRFIDGLGRTIQERRTAEPEPGSATPRCRVSAWQTFNHKGLVVLAYKPTFALSSAFTIGDTTMAAIRTTYDPLGRVVRVTHPDGTFETTGYGTWERTLADRNDNAGYLTADDPRYGEHRGELAGHLDTPARLYVDPLGRVVAEAADNGAELHITRKRLDLLDRVVEVFDARDLGSATWTFVHDGLGRPVRTNHSTGVGERFALTDAAGNPIWSRDARAVEVERAFDGLNRPLHESTRAATGGELRRAWRYVAYDPGAADFAEHQSRNLFGRLEEARDADGLCFFEYDWRGLMTRASHRLWSQQDSNGRAWNDRASALWVEGAGWNPPITDADRDGQVLYLQLPDVDDPTTLVVETDYDAASRPIEVHYPGGMHTRTSYNAAGLVATLEVDRGAGEGYQPIVTAAVYDAYARVIVLSHGNGVDTTRQYDPDVERLVRLTSLGQGTAGPTWFQDLEYRYDPAGNPLEIADRLVDASFSHNRIIPNTRAFRYDPRYRLIEATGKKHRSVRSKDDSGVLVPSPDPNDYEPYTMRYEYDAVGNVTRNEEYAAGSVRYKAGRIDLFNGDETEAASFDDPGAGNYRYDLNGNTLHTPRHEELAYSHDNLLRYVNLAGGGQVRDFMHGPQRTLRMVVKNGVTGLTVYLGPFEYHLRNGVTAYTKTVLQVMGLGRHAQAERVLSGTDPSSLPFFFHHADHLGSGHVLTTAEGGLLSQEEYFAYGRASDRRDARNRYRFVGVERDEDTGLCMTGPRTYDPVTARFLQGDPLAPASPHASPFAYASAAPTRRVDPTGYADEPKGLPPAGTILREPGPPGVSRDLDVANEPWTGPDPNDPATKTALEQRRPLETPGPMPEGAPPVRTVPPDNGLGRGGYGPAVPDPVVEVPATTTRPRPEAKPGVAAEWIPEGAPGGADWSQPRGESVEFDWDPADDPTDEIPGRGSRGASSASSEALEEAGERLVKEGGAESAEWLAKQGTKKLLGVAPGASFVIEYATAPEGQSGWVTLGRAVGGEIALGPLDLTTAVDVFDPSPYAVEWTAPCTAGCHYGSP